MSKNPLTFSRLQRARQPPFPVGIQDRTFQLVEDHLGLLEYHGPVALSCDDTKLLPSFRPYFDHDLDGYYIIGHVGVPYRIADVDAFREVTRNGVLEKATKVLVMIIFLPGRHLTSGLPAPLVVPTSATTQDSTVNRGSQGHIQQCLC